MKIGRKNIIRRCRAGVGILTAAFAFASCSVDQDIDNNGAGGERGIRLMASVSPQVDTRAYQPEGEIREGKFYMTYINNPDNSTFGVCEVNFYDGVGITTTNRGYELNWHEVGELPEDPSLTTFWVDNVPKIESNPNATIINFTDEYNPFVAGVFDNVMGSNDLLWGSQDVAPESTEDIDVALHHYMSRVSVIVTVDNSNEFAEGIDFTNGTVRITNLIHEGESYDRTTGRIDLGENPVYEDLYLKTNPGDWGTITDDEYVRGIKYYQTENYVLPPQQLRTDDKRPRLVLEVPQKDGSMRSYSGVLPRIMFVDGNPANLAFDIEKNLTLKVKLSQDLLYIVTIYAYVQDWVDKGTHLVMGNQAGIYSDWDLSQMIGFYNDNDQNELIRYGYRVGDKWQFDIFGDLEINAEDYAGRMKEGPEFAFDFTLHTLKITQSDGSVISYDKDQAEDAAIALYNLLRFGSVTGKD